MTSKIYVQDTVSEKLKAALMNIQMQDTAIIRHISDDYRAYLFIFDPRPRLTLSIVTGRAANKL